MKEGQTVKAGEVLFVLSGERSSANAGAPFYMQWLDNAFAHL